MLLSIFIITLPSFISPPLTIHFLFSLHLFYFNQKFLFTLTSLIFTILIKTVIGSISMTNYLFLITLISETVLTIIIKLLITHSFIPASF